MGLNVKAVATGLILTIIATIVVFQIVANTAGDLTTAAGNISSSGLPLASLFNSSGIVLLTFMAGILITLVAAYLGGLKGGR